MSQKRKKSTRLENVGYNIVWEVYKFNFAQKTSRPEIQKSFPPNLELHPKNSRHS